MLIDTHCHLYKEYYEDIGVILKEAKEKNVYILLNIGCDKKTNTEVVQTTEDYNNVYAVIGIHPEYSSDYSDSDITEIEKVLSKNKVVAIGEIGLDYHYGKNNIDQQKELFIKLLDIAQKHNLPVVIHSREAYFDTINILKKYHLKGIIHSFSGSLESAEEYIKLGYLIGINGVVTFKNCELGETLKKIPLKNIVLETDSPYLSPEPYRGHKNKPVRIINICQYLATVYGVSEQEIAQQTTKNALELFDIKI